MTDVTLAKGQGSGFDQLDALVAETGVFGADLAEVEFLSVLDPALAIAVAAPCEIFVQFSNLGGHFH